MDADQLYHDDLKRKKCWLNKQQLPQHVVLHQSQIVQSKLEDGAARRQNEKFVAHLVGRMIKAPNSKSADPMEGTVVYDPDEPATHTLEAFIAKMTADPDWSNFKVRIWAHQHLFDARKTVADHFTGTRLEISYRHHQVIPWVGLTYEEESTVSSSHNICSHDVQKVPVVDNLLKLRLTWSKLGCFEAERSNDPVIKKQKLACFKAIGITSQTVINTKHTMWKLATASNQEFFDAVVEASRLHMDGQIKDQQLKPGSEPKQAKSNAKNKRKSTDDESKMFDDFTNQIPHEFYTQLSWIKRKEDYNVILTFLKNLNQGLWNLHEFATQLQRFKSMKYLRLQIRHHVRTQQLKLIST